MKRGTAEHAKHAKEGEERSRKPEKGSHAERAEKRLQAKRGPESVWSRGGCEVGGGMVE
jgi:hypothetical protein